MTSTRGYQKIISSVSTHAKAHPEVTRAANIAQKTNATVTLVHIANPEQNDEVTDDITTHLETLKSSMNEVEEVRLVKGKTWMAINDVVGETQAELLVIGSHVHGQLRTLLGKAGDQVLHHACCDVLVVRSEAYEKQVPSDYQNIVMATDLSEHNKKVCRVATEFSGHFNANLSVLHVVEHFPTDREIDDIPPEDQDPMEYIKNATDKKVTDFLASSECQDIPHEVLVTDDSAKTAIPNYLQEHQVDLIIVGAQAHFGVNIILGSTVDHIAHHAPCDVLVLYTKTCS